MTTASVTDYLTIDYNLIDKKRLYLGSPLGKQVGPLPHSETVIKVIFIAAMIIGVVLFAIGCVALGGVFTPTAAAELSRLSFYISTISSALSMTSIELCLFFLSAGGALFMAGAIATVRDKLKAHQLMRKIHLLYNHFDQTTAPQKISDYGTHKRSRLFKRLRLLYAHYEADRILAKIHTSADNASIPSPAKVNFNSLTENALKTKLQEKLEAIEWHQLFRQYQAEEPSLNEGEKLSKNTSLLALKEWRTKHPLKTTSTQESTHTIYSINREFHMPIFVGTPAFLDNPDLEIEDDESSSDSES